MPPDRGDGKFPRLTARTLPPHSAADPEGSIPDSAAHLTFALIALGMVLTPGPNMVHLISRGICQGRRAGLLSLAGIATGFLAHILCAALGITAIVMAVPYAYDALRLAGAGYLLWLAWQATRPGERSAFQVADLPPAVLRAIFVSGRDISAPRRPWPDREELRQEMLAWRRHHNVSPPELLEDLLAAIATTMRAPVPARVLSRIGPEAEAFRRVQQ